MARKSRSSALQKVERRGQERTNPVRGVDEDAQALAYAAWKSSSGQASGDSVCQ